MGEPDVLLAKLLSLDERLTRPLTIAERRRIPRYLALIVAHTGDSFVWAILLGAAWFFGGPVWKARAIVAFAGLVLLELAVVLIKMSVRRHRPPGRDGLIYRRVDPYSFPSGHAARAVMLSILAFMLGPENAFIGILAWSPLMVFSRIAIGIHYLFDVLAGVVLGAVLTFLVLKVAEMVLSRL